VDKIWEELQARLAAGARPPAGGRGS
jgi:hypothetical protein